MASRASRLAASASCSRGADQSDAVLMQGRVNAVDKPVMLLCSPCASSFAPRLCVQGDLKGTNGHSVLTQGSSEKRQERSWLGVADELILVGQETVQIAVR